MPEPSTTIEHYDRYWERVEDSYPAYPTIRHRKRFILNALDRLRRAKRGRFSVFDFGCGEGTLLAEIQRRYSLGEDDVGGCDIAPGAVARAGEKVRSRHLRAEPFPALNRTFDAIVCSEVIEHTTEYRRLLQWMHGALEPGGELILTTQAGKIHASDVYTGHTQHFVIGELTALLRELGYEVEYRRLWGFPLFTIQKYLTDVNFDSIRTAYLEGGLSARKRVVFALAYALYFLHDAIPFGPQIYIRARKPVGSGR